MADGGEGTMAALVDALQGEVVRATVTGPLGDPVEAAFGLADGADGRLAIVEMALGVRARRSCRRRVATRASPRPAGPAS